MIKGEYIGWHKYTNFGDNVLYQIIKSMGVEDTIMSNMRIYGGGTILPITKKLEDTIKNKQPEDIICIGTGVTHSNFGGKDYKKNMLDIRKSLKNSKYIGIRSTAERDRLGFGEVIGDPFFSIKPPIVKKDDNLIILNVSQSHGNCWGGLESESKTFLETLKFTKEYLIKKLKKKIIIVYLCETDTTLAITASEYLKCSYINHIPSLNELLSFFTNASMIISYKLHAMITALNVNTPVLPIEYNQKIRDVAQDFDIDKYILRTDEVTKEKLIEKFKMLKNWDFKKVAKQKKIFTIQTYNFLNKVKMGEILK